MITMLVLVSLSVMTSRGVFMGLISAVRSRTKTAVSSDMDSEKEKRRKKRQQEVDLSEY